MEEWIVEILKTYGLAGLVIAVEGYVIRKLYNRNQELHDALTEVGKESVKANLEIAGAMTQLAEGNRSTAGVVHQLSQMVQQLIFRSGGKVE